MHYNQLGCRWHVTRILLLATAACIKTVGLTNVSKGDDHALH